MLGNKRKERAVPFRALLTPQLRGLSEPLRAGSIWTGNVLEFLEIRRVFLRNSACSQPKLTTAEWMQLMGPDPNGVKKKPITASDVAIEADTRGAMALEAGYVDFLRSYARRI